MTKVFCSKGQYKSSAIYLSALFNVWFVSHEIKTNLNKHQSDSDDSTWDPHMLIFVHYSMLCMVLDILIILTWNTDREKWTDRQVPASALTLTGRSIVKGSQNNNKHGKTMHKNSPHCTVYSTDPKQHTPYLQVYLQYIYNITVPIV